MERAEARSVRARNFLVQRLAWLFVFGAIHLFLIWNGDILMLYASGDAIATMAADPGNYGSGISQRVSAK